MINAWPRGRAAAMRGWTPPPAGDRKALRATGELAAWRINGATSTQDSNIKLYSGITSRKETRRLHLMDVAITAPFRQGATKPNPESVINIFPAQRTYKDIYIGFNGVSNGGKMQTTDSAYSGDKGERFKAPHENSVWLVRLSALSQPYRRAGSVDQVLFQVVLACSRTAQKNSINRIRPTK